MKLLDRLTLRAIHKGRDVACRPFWIRHPRTRRALLRGLDWAEQDIKKSARRK